MALKRETHLDNTPAEQDQTHRTDQTEDKITEVVHHGEGVIVCSKSRYAQAHNQGQHQYHRYIETEALFYLAGHRQLIGFLLVAHCALPPICV